MGATTAMRVADGTALPSSSTYFSPIPVALKARPVTFLPGRARLSTNPASTGSSTTTMTMGIVQVAWPAARFSRNPVATITSTPSCTNSWAIPATRSDFPAAKRRSITMFCPSTYPRARRPSRNASHCGDSGRDGPLPTDSRPIRGTFPATCCASGGERRGEEPSRQVSGKVRRFTRRSSV
jgi:hypothetical protein